MKKSKNKETSNLSMFAKNMNTTNLGGELISMAEIFNHVDKIDAKRRSSYIADRETAVA